MPLLKILVVGRSEVALDLRTDALPVGDEIKIGEGYGRAPGGAGLIIASAAAKLGASVSLSSKIGSDGEGGRLLSFLAASGVDTYYLREEKTLPTPLSVRITEFGKSRRHLIFEGAISAFTAEDCKAAFAYNPDIVLLHTAVPEAAIAAAVEMARNYSIPLICDIEGPLAARFDISKLTHASVVILDRAAAERYTGIAPAEVEDCLKIGMAISAKTSAGTVIIRLGDRGSFIYDGRHYDFSAGREVYPVDESGSSECFAAAFTVKYAIGCGVRESAEYAAVAEAISMSRIGGVSSAPSGEDIENYLSK